MAGEQKRDDPQGCKRFPGGCFWRDDKGSDTRQVRDKLKLARVRAELEVLALGRISGTIEFKINAGKLESDFREVFTAKPSQKPGEPLEKLNDFWPVFEAWMKSMDCAIKAHFMSGYITRIDTR